MNDPVEIIVARLDERQEHLIALVEKHIAAGCADNDCKLNDRVVVMEESLKWQKRGSWALLTLLIGNFVKGFFNG